MVALGTLRLSISKRLKAKRIGNAFATWTYCDTLEMGSSDTSVVE